jgi:hypothetical protein
MTERISKMFPVDIGLVFVLGAIFGLAVLAALTSLPRFWRWFKYSVWKDLNYAQGYRKGLADGRTIARRSENE